MFEQQKKKINEILARQKSLKVFGLIFNVGRINCDSHVGLILTQLLDQLTEHKQFTWF
jgi:hypothetical protein